MLEQKLSMASRQNTFEDMNEDEKIAAQEKNVEFLRKIEKLEDERDL